jgi:hypothetical protein
MTGRILRLGDSASFVPNDAASSVPTYSSAGYQVSYSVFELDANYSLKDATESTVTDPANNFVPVYIIGAAPDSKGNFTGPNQDVSAMTSLIHINTSN